jgi:hypothetical protein
MPRVKHTKQSKVECMVLNLGARHSSLRSGQKRPEEAKRSPLSPDYII